MVVALQIMMCLSELAYGNPRNDPGAVVVATGTPGTSGTYKHSVISYTSTGNSIAKRNDW